MNAREYLKIDLSTSKTLINSDFIKRILLINL